MLNMTPSNGDVHGLLAETLLRQQKYDEAAGHYQQFLAYRPNDISTLMQLGIAYVALGRPDDAIVQFRRIVELEPPGCGRAAQPGACARREPRLRRGRAPRAAGGAVAAKRRDRARRAGYLAGRPGEAR